MSFIPDGDPNYSPHLDALALAIIVAVCVVALLAKYLFH